MMTRTLLVAICFFGLTTVSHAQDKCPPGPQVTSIIANLLKVAPETVTPSANLETDLKADELHRVELVMALEEKFDIRIKDEEFDPVKTVGDTIAFVEARLTCPTP